MAPKKGAAVKIIGGVKYDRRLLEQAEKAAAAGQVSLPDAKQFVPSAEDGSGFTEIEHRTLEHILKSFRFTEKASEFLKKALRPKGTSSFRVIEGVKYDRDLLEQAEMYSRDGQVSFVEAERLVEMAQDGQGMSDIAYRTLEYIGKNIQITTKGAEHIRKMLSKVPNGGSAGDKAKAEAQQKKDDAAKKKAEEEEAAKKAAEAEEKARAEAEAEAGRKREEEVKKATEEKRQAKVEKGKTEEEEAKKAAAAKDSKAATPTAAGKAKGKAKSKVKGKAKGKAKVKAKGKAKGKGSKGRGKGKAKAGRGGGKAPSQYKQIDGVSYAGGLLDMAAELGADKEISQPDAEKLWIDAQGGPGFTATVKRTLKRIMDKHRFTDEAAAYLKEQLEKMPVAAEADGASTLTLAVVTPKPKGLSGLRKKIIESLGGQDIGEAISEAKEMVKHADACVGEVDALIAAQARQEAEAMAEFEAIKNKVQEAMDKEVGVAHAFRALKRQHEEVTSDIQAKRNALRQAQQKLSTLEVIALNHARQAELERKKKEATAAAEDAKRQLLEQRQKEKEALEVTRRALQEMRQGTKKVKKADEETPATVAPATATADDGEPEDIE